MAAWTRRALPALVVVLAVAGCASRPDPPATQLVPSAGSGVPVVAPADASTPASAAGPALEPAPSRQPLDVGAGTGSDVIVTGALDPDGSYRIRSVIPEPRDLGVIPDIEARIPPPLDASRQRMGNAGAVRHRVARAAARQWTPGR